MEWINAQPDLLIIGTLAKYGYAIVSITAVTKYQYILRHWFDPNSNLIFIFTKCNRFVTTIWDYDLYCLDEVYFRNDREALQLEWNKEIASLVLLGS